MRALFYSVVLSIIVVFIYWTCVYFNYGYNLTNNVAHLDIKSMLKTLNSSQYLSGINYDKIISSIESDININNDFLKLNPSWSHSGVFKLVINAINVLVRGLNMFMTPFVLALKSVINFVSILNRVLGFVIACLYFIFHPVFI